MVSKQVLRKIKVLRKMAELIEERLDELALIESQDNGKPLSVTKTVDIPRAAINLQFFADSSLPMVS